MAHYKMEFPDFDSALYCPTGFIDVSYHNDIMPHVRKEMQVNGKDVEINIWQDYEDEDKREYDNTKRYILSIVVDGEVIEEFPTDNLNDIKRYVANLDKIVNAVLKQVYEKVDIKSVTNKILEGLSVRNAILSVVKESADFKKGDVVVAKPEFIAAHETPEDTLGIVIDYNPDNDYLLLGEIHPEKHAIPHTYSMRGEFYRLVKPEEYNDFGLSETVCNESSVQEMQKQLKYKLHTILNNWGSYIGDFDQWKNIVDEAAEYVWESYVDSK